MIALYAIYVHLFDVGTLVVAYVTNHTSFIPACPCPILAWVAFPHGLSSQVHLR